MAPSFFITLLLLLSLISFFQSSSTLPLCREFERLALMQFKNSFLIVKNASIYPFAYPKVDLWKSQGSDCCSWEGITCSQHTGHVVGVELNSGCLFGSINSSSTLFSLGHLRYLNLADNHFNYSSIPSEFGNLSRGSLPIPPHSITIYTVSSNQFNGEIPLEFCDMTSLQHLDLSGNNLSGIIPQCLGNRSTRLSNLNLGQNNLRGELPRPLANCKDLELLDVSDNQIRDTFPSWLGLLPHLKIIILRSNRLYGEIDGPKPDSMFPELRIVDLSHNEFLGPLPLKYFLQGNVMANIHDDNKATYLGANYSSNKIKIIEVPYTMTITNKGNKMRYGAILNIFAAIDLSSNKFSGGILKTVGNLRKLDLLNLSNNVLVGPIPPALGNLSKLEALDLSSNKLSGRIPTELTQLNFLEVFEVSNNLLTGPIPRGSQFDTFENSSFQGNPELCGMPLSKKCGNHAPPLPSSSEENGHISFLSEIGWKAVLIGCGCGFLGGVVLGVKVFARKQEWFMTTFRIKQGRRSGFRRS